MRYVMRQKMFSLADSFQIKDEEGRDAFVVNGKVFSLAKQLSFQDPLGNALLSIKQELMTFAPTYEIFKDDSPIAEVKKELFNVFSYRFSIDLPGSPPMVATGNFLDHEYVISRGESPVATVSKQWFTLTDTYGVDIGAGENDVLVLAITVVIDMVCHPDHK
jgi:uncharacterized protein YxjI